MEWSSIGYEEHLAQMETGFLTEDFTFEGCLPSMFEEPLEMVNPFQESLEMDNPFQESLEMDIPFQESFDMDSSFEDDTKITTKQKLRAEDEPRVENGKAKKKRHRRAQAAKKDRKVPARPSSFEALSKQAGNQNGRTIFEGLARRARERAGNDPNDTDIEIMAEEERMEMGPWISQITLEKRYASGDRKPWYSERARPSTKAKPKRAQVAAPKPSQPAQTDPPKRGRGRPRKYALDDPRSSLYRVNRQKNGVRQSKKAARNFTIHEDNEGTNGVSQSSKPGRAAVDTNGISLSLKPRRSAAWQPLTPRLTPRLNFQLPSSGGNFKNPALAKSGIGEDVEPDASNEASPSFGANASPRLPGGGGKSVRRPSKEALFYPLMCPGENEFGDEMAHLEGLSLPYLTPPPSPMTDDWMARFKHRTEYYYRGGYVEDLSR
ncbi:MAG: hypothetical protein OHK93_008299 [Ramalina farinacea]|uniref:Uncharacterized protein n=1 Tax=Ramalina farinacea TaxID=258253 RepID=A0AA43QNC6_9LECA|nr:hypothetical protein [Ramalina farinacea]